LNRNTQTTPEATPGRVQRLQCLAKRSFACAADAKAALAHLQKKN